MYGPTCSHVNEIAKLPPADQMLSTGLVDYALGAAPHTGAFVVVYEDSPLKMDQLKYYKMGDGPFYVFYTPFHLPHIQLASTIARAALNQDPTVSASGRPVCEVLTMAKRDLSSGEVLDGVGGFMSYGVIEKAAVCFSNNFLPMGLSEGCRLRRSIVKDQPVSYTDVVLPPNRLCDKLKAEQNTRFFDGTA